MNKYKKYYPNVFLAETDQEYKKGDVIVLVTKYGKENEHIIHNLVKEKDGKFYYSITRKDGFNIQELAKRKADRKREWAESAERKSDEYYEASQEGKDFLALAEPIKIGHHSEKRHRALIDRNWNRMGKAIEFSDKAEIHKKSAEYWESKKDTINLSMPESLEYYKFEMEKAEKNHAEMKASKEKRRHGYALTYAKKKANEMKKKYEIAIKLWA